MPPPVVRVVAVLTLLVLLSHAWVYRFLCDDAFISFRYARNLAHGRGLVFNPGLARVEGFTNFLWVVLLAALDRVGLAPERAANALSLAATIGLWGCVVWFARRRARAGLVALLPAALLAITRSIAVWSTSGLETRLFELLVVGGVMRVAIELEPVPEGGRARRPLAGWLLGLAALTRPEGVMLGVSVTLTAGWFARARGPQGMRWLAATVAPFAALVIAHFLFRKGYYGDWLPNTYYAKVDGHLRWDWGFAYLGAFALEYGVPLWLPFLALGARRLSRSGAALVVAMFAAVAVPLLIYVAAVGGDHFEYRPLDLLFPFAFLVVGEGVAALAEWRRARGLAFAGTLALAWGLVDLPMRSHLEFPAQYASGFPGLVLESSAEARDFLAPEKDPVLGLPGLRAIAGAHRALVRSLSSHFVALRQEEHLRFLEIASEQGRRLRALVDRGVLPRNARIADDCVGAIPYLSDLLVLDRHGLTDAVIARRPAGGSDLMAHEKAATLEDGRRFGVELWPAAPVDLVLPLTSPRVLYALTHPVQDSLPVYVADLDPDGVLVAFLPLGREHVASRMPALHLVEAADTAFARAYMKRATPAFVEWLRQHPEDVERRNSLAYLLLVQHRPGEALEQYDELARQAPENALVWEEIASCQHLLGRSEEERAALQRALALANASGDSPRAARVSARLAVLSVAR